MKNKNKKGVALAMVLIIVVIFTLIGTAMLLGAMANANQARLVSAVNFHFYATESYLHTRMHQINEDMQADLLNRFETRVMSLLPIPLYMNYPLPGGYQYVGQFIASQINSAMAQQGFIAGVTSDITTAFNTAYAAALVAVPDTGFYINDEMSFVLAPLPTPVAIPPGGGGWQHRGCL